MEMIFLYIFEKVFYYISPVNDVGEMIRDSRLDGLLETLKLYGSEDTY